MGKVEVRLFVRVVLVVAALLTAGSGCADEHPRLETAGEDLWFGLSMYERKGGVPFVLSDEIRVCVDRPGMVEVVDVSLEYSLGGLRVDDFDVRPHAENYPVMETDGHALAEFGGFDGDPAVVNVVCSDGMNGGPGMHLGVQLSKPHNATARGANLLVDYLSGSERHTLRVEFELILCETADESGECDYWELEQYEQRMS